MKWRTIVDIMLTNVLCMSVAVLDRHTLRDGFQCNQPTQHPWRYEDHQLCLIRYYGDVYLEVSSRQLKDNKNIKLNYECGNCGGKVMCVSSWREVM